MRRNVSVAMPPASTGREPSRSGPEQGSSGVSKEEADVYAEGLRRGGAVVSARVADADAPRLQAIMDRSSVKLADRSTAYRNAGWKSFDPAATPYTADQVRKERELYR